LVKGEDTKAEQDFEKCLQLDPGRKAELGQRIEIAKRMRVASRQ